ncbi:hypothetical protein L3X38_003235 [Prunus dulcis]|uniref:Uncharacterized protein n=1 Tax=Prunus dulcis TaxID=3755 RepID=A0AAD5F1Q8_PRUDU|nr:hypothetical protein L3X38_003235 [Prunus dulcis]
MHVGSKTSCGYGEATEEELMDAMAMVSSKVSSSNHKMEARWSNIGFMANRGSEAEEDNHFGLLCDDNDDDQCSSQNNNNNSMDLQLAKDHLSHVAEFNAAHGVDSMQGMAQNALAASGVAITPPWIYPSPSFVKLNCDGAWAAKTGQRVVGWVSPPWSIDEGTPGWHWLFPLCGWHKDLCCVSALTVEAEAVREALVSCLEFGHDKDVNCSIRC